MVRQRLDQFLVVKGLVETRSQAESYIRLGYVLVDGQAVTKPGFAIRDNAVVTLTREEQYVSRAALKLESVAEVLKLDFRGKVVLDVGSSTGGFTEYALQHGARKVIAVDVGTNQLHPRLRGNERIELHEQTDIRNLSEASEPVDVVLIDVSFISLREVLPAILRLVTGSACIVAMAKPQFEASGSLKHKGIIKNDRIRREILKEFETWVQQFCIIENKVDSGVSGAKGNRERFYRLRKV